MNKLSDHVITLKPDDISPAFRSYSLVFLQVMAYESTLPKWKRLVRALLRRVGIKVFQARITIEAK